jgi:hypothetical protein
MSTAEPEMRHVLRQRGTVALGLVAVVILVVLVGLAVAGDELRFGSGLALAAAAAHVTLVRPSVGLSLDGVHLNNPLRRTMVPWGLLQDAAARWSLEVYAADRAYPAWAVSTRIDRPKAVGPMGVGGVRLPRADPLPPAGTLESGRCGGAVTAPAAAAFILDAKAEWDQAVADGTIPAAPDAVVTRRWDLPDIALLATPALVLLGTALS